jgi:hypothetical protein
LELAPLKLKTIWGKIFRKFADCGIF